MPRYFKMRVNGHLWPHQRNHVLAGSAADPWFAIKANESEGLVETVLKDWDVDQHKMTADSTELVVYTYMR